MDFGMPFLLETESIEDCCKLAKELGLAFVELNGNFPPCTVSRLEAVELQRLSEHYGLYFTLHLEEECDLFALNPDVRAAWLQTLRRSLLLARALQMPVVNMHFPKGVYITLPTERVFLYERYAAEFSAALDELRRLCEEELAETSTRIVIENTNGWMPWQREAIETLLASPVFGLTLDIGHSHAIGDADEDFFRQHASQLCHMHGHDARGKSNHLALGDGEIRLAERFAWARECGARVVLETKTIEALRTSVSRLPEILAEIC